MNPDTQPSETQATVAAPPPLVITHYDMRFPVLQQKSLLCDLPLAGEDALVVQRMATELKNMGDDAVGLAAVQIGIARRVFVMRRDDGTILTCINPRILSQSKEFTRKAEGCLSLPNVMAFVNRPKSILLSYYDSFGFEFQTEFRGMEAKIVSHEMDHLNGTMINSHIERQMEKAERLRNERLASREKAKLKRRKMAKIHKRMNRRK
jgi:peptide deformylase